MLTGLTCDGLRRWIAMLVLGATCATSLTGCSRQFWRKQADRDSYNAIGEKLSNPHWQVPRIELTPDRRSRFFDPYDPDKEPLPPDDPTAHASMHCVNGRKGYKSWHKLGQSFALENPHWLEPYGVSVEGADPVIGHSAVKLNGVTLPQLVDLACIHSREYQTTIEDLYLDALDLTAERFRLGVRFLDTGAVEPGASYTNRTNSRGEGTGVFGASFGLSQALPTGGQIAVDIANSVTWVFAGSGSQMTAPSIGYSVTQPLLFRAGRKIALEPLTQAERNVLYSARTLARFRQTLFSQVTSSYLNLLQLRQGILNAENNIRQLEDQLEAQAARDSYIYKLVSVDRGGFVEELVVPDGLRGKLRSDENFIMWIGPMADEDETAIFEISDDPEFQAAAQILVQLARQQATSLSYLQLRDRLNRAETQLANNRRQLADQQDNLKILLGLPPNVSLDVDESALTPFNLISYDLIGLEKNLRVLQQELGDRLLPNRKDGDDALVVAPEYSALRDYVMRMNDLADTLERVGLEQVRTDFEPVRQLLVATEGDWSIALPGHRYFRSQAERDRLVENIEKNVRLYRVAESEFRIGRVVLQMLKDVLEAESLDAFVARLDANSNAAIELSELPPGWADVPRTGTADVQSAYSVDELLIEIGAGARIIRDKQLLRVAQGLEVVQAAVRVEAIAVNPFSLDGTMKVPDIEEVVNLSLENRHDLMNAQAAVMDSRRQIEIAANRLESALDVRFSGEQGLNKDASGLTGHSASLLFTSPLDQVLERNAYRTALVNYQRARRTYMEAEDRIKQAVRQSWRQIQVQEYRLEIDRTTVRNAALQYDSASLQAQGAAQTNALSLVNALDSVLQAQNALVGDWITYETNRLNIHRDMGIMGLDPRGVWVDSFYQQMDASAADESTNLPAPTPDAVLPAPEPQN